MEKQEWNFEDEFKMAQAWLEADGHFAPTAFVKTKTKTLAVVLEFDKSQEAKRRCFREVTEIALLENAQSVTLVINTWVSTSCERRPSEAPDRREALVVQVIGPDGHVKNGTMKLYHRVGGKIVWGEQHRDKWLPRFLVGPWAKTAKTA